MNAIDPIAAVECWSVSGTGPFPQITNLSVHRHLAEIEKEWRAFEKRALGTFYQTYAWCSAWQDTAGLETSSPRIVIGRDSREEIAFLLPLCVRRRGRVSVLEFIAAPQTTYGYGFYAPALLPVARNWFSTAGRCILDLTGPIDAVHLASLPEGLYGHAHPLSSWFTCTGANVAYRTRLHPDFDALYRSKRSASTRRSHRKRDAKLDAAGQLAFGLPSDQTHAQALLRRMFVHQRTGLAERGIHNIFDERDRAFIHRLAELDGPDGPALLPYSLTLDGELLSMKLGGLSGGTFWALISSVDPSRVRQFSPGDAALRRLFEACCRSGLQTLDLASGDTGYKRSWADEVIPLHECIRGRTVPGLAWAVAKAAEVLAKRTIKSSRVLWPLASALRKRLAGRRG